MFRFTAILAFLLTVFLTAVLFTVADKAVNKAVFVVFTVPLYLIGLLALLLVASLNRYVFKAGFKPGFLVAAVVATLVMVGGHAWLSNDSFWMLMKSNWPLYGIFLGTHAAAYVGFLDAGRYWRFRALFFAQ
ncbi:hypothetical protein [Hymenobacter persicinus]|uniref:Uncharacterized protein n=1 Tax=Hymenobacter persicinus TaxID=2025506 RepID=A0A4Q5LAP0_9BACT|nr:hypothetical protein [Hymenobacter persicinus]RYU79063.1 hypothetical protein EWM57_11925 [Hymenobacter persicinus]